MIAQQYWKGVGLGVLTPTLVAPSFSDWITITRLFRLRSFLPFPNEYSKKHSRSFGLVFLSLGLHVLTIKFTSPQTWHCLPLSLNNHITTSSFFCIHHLLFRYFTCYTSKHSHLLTSANNTIIQPSSYTYHDLHIHWAWHSSVLNLSHLPISSLRSWDQ